MARPTSLTPERHEAIVRSLRGGNTWRHAASCAGVEQSTVFLWQKKGREGDPGPESRPGAYVEFFEQTTAAVNRVERAVVLCWYRAAKKDWKAAQAYLERRKEDWRMPKEDMTNLSDEDLLAALEKHAGEIRERIEAKGKAPAGEPSK